MERPSMPRPAPYWYTAGMLRSHTSGELTAKDTGKPVTLAGWVHRRRDHGGLIFIDLRDRYGLTQLVIGPDDKDAFKVADTARPEWVLRATGKVRKPVSYTHLRAHETDSYLVCRLLLEK